MRRHVLAALVATVLLGGCSAGSGEGPQAGPAPGSPDAAADPPPASSGGSAQQDPPRVPAALRRIEEYVALGDSYTAAPGVPSSDPASRACFRSDSNYPALVARRLPDATLRDVSCGSADTSHARQPQRTIDGPVPPQLEALSRDTDLVTVGLGGNDGNVFGALVGYCTRLRGQDPTGAPCREAMQTPSGDRLLTALDSLPGRLVDVVTGVRERSPDARILLVGYPRIVPAEDTCPDILPLADGDYAYAREVGERLNGAVAAAARETGVAYVDVATASRGHDVCSAKPWVNGRTTAPDAQVYHPFPAHQRAVARMVLRELVRG